MGLKFQNDENNGFAFDSGEHVVAVHLESSYSKQDNKLEHSSDFEISKAVDTDLNQLSMGVSGQEETVKYRRELSCSSFPILLRARDNPRSLEFEYPELCRLLFGKQRVS